MSLITIISGTNRRSSETETLAQLLFEKCRERSDHDVKLLTLTELPPDMLHMDMYAGTGQVTGIRSIQDEYFLPAAKFWFVFPEYNGGIPGILKLAIDAISVRSLQETFHGKKACLTGISTGRAGNLRGLDHLTSILHYLRVIVYPYQVPISSIRNLKDQSGRLVDEKTWHALDQQLEGFLRF